MEAEQVSSLDTPSPTKRRRSSRLLSSLADSSSEGKETSSKSGKISLAEMEQLKARVDHCLANDIEMDLVRNIVLFAPGVLLRNISDPLTSL